MVTFTSPIGRLAVDRYDFQDHIDGYQFQHNADAIMLEPSINFSDVPQTNVYSALSQISSELDELALSGKGFITIGDGYDTYHNSIDFPDNPYDSNIPAFDSYLNDVLNNSSNPLYFRIRDGGVVLIKAGTYKFTDTVDVPPGIILLGEGYGTKIVNQMSTPTPLFQIKADTNRIPDTGVDSTEKFIFCKETMFINLTIADNFLEPKFLGDLSYKDPINNDSSTSLISLEEGASLSCENVRLVGKTTYSLGVISDITSFAIKTDSTLPVSTGTRLKVFNSSIDGFSVPIQFTASGKFNDHFIMTNTLIRGYGFLNSDFAAAANNSILKLNACNINISNNYCFGYDDTIDALAYIVPSSPTPNVQSKAKINITNNNIAIDRTNNSSNINFQLVIFSGALNSSLLLFAHGNIFQGNSFDTIINEQTPLTISESIAGLDVSSNITLDAGSDITLDAGSNIYISGSTISLDGQIYYNVVDVSTTPYTVDGTVYNYVILVSSNVTAITINLPTPTVGRTLIIKDKGNAETNNITLARLGGSGSIEGVASDYIIDADYQIVKLVADGTNWWIVGS